MNPYPAGQPVDGVRMGFFFGFDIARNCRSFFLGYHLLTDSYCDKTGVDLQDYRQSRDQKYEGA